MVHKTFGNCCKRVSSRISNWPAESSYRLSSNTVSMVFNRWC